MENIEQAPERIPSKEEVLEIMYRKAEGLTIERELSDENGVYLLETRTPEKNGEYTQYVYMRKGQFQNTNGSEATVIYSVEYMNGEPCGGSTVANCAEGAWQEIE